MPLVKRCAAAARRASGSSASPIHQLVSKPRMTTTSLPGTLPSARGHAWLLAIAVVLGDETAQCGCRLAPYQARRVHCLRNVDAAIPSRRFRPRLGGDEMRSRMGRSWGRAACRAGRRDAAASSRSERVGGGSSGRREPSAAAADRRAELGRPGRADLGRLHAVPAGRRHTTRPAGAQPVQTAGDPGRLHRTSRS